MNFHELFSDFYAPISIQTNSKRTENFTQHSSNTLISTEYLRNQHLIPIERMLHWGVGIKRDEMLQPDGSMQHHNTGRDSTVGAAWGAAPEAAATIGSSGNNRQQYTQGRSWLVWGGATQPRCTMLNVRSKPRGVIQIQIFLYSPV